MSLPLSSFVFRPSLVRKDLLPDTPALYAGVELKKKASLDWTFLVPFLLKGMKSMEHFPSNDLIH